MTADLIRELEPELSENYLISYTDGPMHPETFSRRYKKFMNDFIEYFAKKDIKIDYIRIHEMRHTRASLWVSEDKSLFAIANQMGWANLDMLKKRYGHVNVDTVRTLLDI